LENRAQFFGIHVKFIYEEFGVETRTVAIGGQ
jgi:hypothetical protein